MATRKVLNRFLCRQTRRFAILPYEITFAFFIIGRIVGNPENHIDFRVASTGVRSSSAGVKAQAGKSVDRGRERAAGRR